MITLERYIGLSYFEWNILVRLIKDPDVRVLLGIDLKEGTLNHK